MSRPVEQNVVNSFTQGGQYLNNFIVMARQNAVRIILAALVISTIIGSLLWYKNATNQDRYVLMNEALYTSISFVNKEFDKEIYVNHEDGSRTLTTVKSRLQNPIYAQDVSNAKELFTSAAIVGGFWGIVVAWLFFWISARIGFNLAKDKHVRGAMLKTPRELQKAISIYNRDEARKQNNTIHIPYKLAGIDYPFRAETQHTLAVGSTGSGKTQGIHGTVEQIYERGDRAVIYDKMRSFPEKFYREGIDVLLNPLDKRCPAWDMFGDARHIVDWENLAQAMIPNENTKDPYFEDTARTVFAHTARRVALRAQEGGRRPLISDLIYMITSSSDSDYHEFLKGSPAAVHINPENSRTTGSIRSTLSNAIRSLGYLRDPREGETPFSIRAWMDQDDGKSVVFLTSREDLHATLQPLLTMWIALFVSALMSKQRDPNRMIWFLLDELPSLNRLPGLESALAEARQYGGCYLIGIQLISQLVAIYGREGADTILGLCRNKLVFNPGDPKTGQLMADYIGKQEVNRKDHSMSIGATELRDGQSVSNRLTQDHIVMPEELSQLPALTAYLSFTGNFPVTLIELEYQSLEGDQAGFVEDVDAITRAESIYDIRPKIPTVIVPVVQPKEIIGEDITHDFSGNDENEQLFSYEDIAKPNENVEVNTADFSDYDQAYASPNVTEDPSNNDDVSEVIESDMPTDTPGSPKPDAPSPPLSTGGNDRLVDEPRMDMIQNSTSVDGISPLTTMIATDERTTEKASRKGVEETQIRSDEERKRRERLAMDDERFDMPAHGAGDHVPDHFGGR